MRAPDFWGAPVGPIAKLLAPLGALYGAAAKARLARPAPRANLPTIAIGGLTLGGDGKTPTALALGAILLERGDRPFFLSRGHGRRNQGAAPFVVDPARHDARDVGDEALLLARVAPTIVGADRAAAARLAETLGAGALVLDDGLHGRRLDPDLAILVVDADYGAGDGFCPPAGPLRAPLAAQLAAADVIVVIGDGRGLREPLSKPAFPARLAPDRVVASRIGGARIFAFAGIGRPAKFAKTLHEIGADVAGLRWFPDHHFYSPRELAALAREAARRHADLVTTGKDAARIGSNLLGLGVDVETLPVTLLFERPEAVNSLLADFLARARTARL
jgi:tetraacyldisaccharide 4'-kinase